MIPFLMQGFRFSPPPAYQGIAHKGLCVVSPTGGGVLYRPSGANSDDSFSDAGVPLLSTTYLSRYRPQGASYCAAHKGLWVITIVSNLGETFKSIGNIPIQIDRT